MRFYDHGNKWHPLNYYFALEKSELEMVTQNVKVIYTMVATETRLLGSRFLEPRNITSFYFSL